MTESSQEITLRNHKENDVTVDVVETIPAGEWTIEKKSHEFVKKDAQTAVFTVAIPKDGEVKVTYTVRTQLEKRFPMGATGQRMRGMRGMAAMPAPADDAEEAVDNTGDASQPAVPVQ